MTNNKESIFWGIWISYAMYYFGRANLSLVMPILLATAGFSKYNVGWVASGFFFAYAVGQFVHGQISEKFNPYYYIAAGLIGSAIANAFLGFFGLFFWLLFLGEIADGFIQAMGWSSCVRASAELPGNKERRSTILGTSYQVGNSIVWLTASYAIGAWGWQWGFWIAAVVMGIKAILLLIYMPKDYVVPEKKIGQQVKATLNFPIVFSGFSLGLLNMIRYGVMTWIPVFLWEVEQLPIGKIGFKIFLIPILGVIGTLLYLRFNKKKDIATVVYLLLLAAVFIVFPYVGPTGTTILLLASGFLVYGPHVFLVSTMPSRFVDKKIVAASTGFINGMGYVGTTVVGLAVPFILSLYDWHAVFWFWSALAIVIIMLVLAVYFKTGGRHETYEAAA